MEHVKSSKYSEEQIKKAGRNYAKYLGKNCNPDELIEILRKNHENFFPDELCIAHLKD